MRVRRRRDDYIFVGRHRTAPSLSWNKEEWIDGELCDVTPAPGRTYTRETWPPRGRGRGESLISPRRIEAKLRACKVFELRLKDHTWASIACTLGYKDASGAYRAYRRCADRLDWDKNRQHEQFLERVGITEKQFHELRMQFYDDEDEWEEEQSERRREQKAAYMRRSRAAKRQEQSTGSDQKPTDQ